MGEIEFNYINDEWIRTVRTPVGDDETVVLFRNASEHPCDVAFADRHAFGILGICLAPNSAFPLVFRRAGTAYGQSMNWAINRREIQPPTGGIPPG